MSQNSSEAGADGELKDGTGPPVDRDPRRWWMLALVGVAELFGMSLWFTASSVAGELGARWSLDPGSVGWLTTSVSLGFVVGTGLAAVLNLADVIGSRVYFAAAAVLAGVANGLGPVNTIEVPRR